MPCNETITSLYELRSRNYDLQKQLRIMNDEIVEGDDMFGKDAEEVKAKKITESMQEAFDKIELIAKITQLIDSVNEALNTELRRWLI